VHVEALVGVAALQPPGKVGSHIRYIVAEKRRCSSPHPALKLMKGLSVAVSFGRLTENRLPPGVPYKQWLSRAGNAVEWVPLLPGAAVPHTRGRTPALPVWNGIPKRGTLFPRPQIHGDIASLPPIGGKALVHDCIVGAGPNHSPSIYLVTINVTMFDLSMTCPCSSGISI
jgi:hypothetical protein